MKTLILCLLSLPVFSQFIIKFDDGDIITDSIVWRLQIIDNMGDTTCIHEWVYGDSHDAKPGQFCCVNHNGFHCDWRDQVRPQICRKCLRKETWREHWYQHRNTPPKSEYEILNEQIDSVLIDTINIFWNENKIWMDSIYLNGDTILTIKP